MSLVAIQKHPPVVPKTKTVQEQSIISELVQELQKFYEINAKTPTKISQTLLNEVRTDLVNQSLILAQLSTQFKHTPKKDQSVTSSNEGIDIDLTSMQKGEFYITEYKGEKYVVRLTDDDYVETFEVIE